MRRSTERSRPSALALLVAGAFFMEFLDGSIIATALPHMAPALHATAVGLNVGMSAYLLTVAVFILPSGWAADRFGSRRVFATAIVVFTAGSILCGLSTSLPEFVAARVLQGLGGAMMVPVGRLTVLRATPRHELMGAIAVLTWPGLAAPVIAPPIGGFLADAFSWRWIFFLNVPLGVAGLLLSLRLFPDDRGSARPFDMPGFVGGALACLGATLLLDRIGQPGAADWQVVLLGSALVVVLVGLRRHLRRCRHPLIDLGPFGIATFSRVAVGGTAMRTLVSTMPFLLPLLFELGYGIDAVHAGLLVLCLFAGNLGMKPFTSSLLTRWGFRTTLVCNGLLQSATMLACATVVSLRIWPVTVLLLVLSGASRSLQFTALNTLAFADVPERWTNPANTIFSVAFQLGLGFGVSVGALCLRLASSTSGPDRHAFDVALIAIAAATALVALDGLRLRGDDGAAVIRRTATA